MRGPCGEAPGPVVAGLLAGALALAGCAGPGSDSATESGSGDAAPTVLFGDCRTDDPALGGARTAVQADLDGDGAAEPVALVPSDADGPCAGSLLATVAGRTTAVPLGPGPGAEAGAELVVVQLKGTPRELLLARGPLQPRTLDLVLYGAEDGALGPVLVDGRPVLEAGGGLQLPSTARCTDDGGIAVLAGRTHRPPGIVLAWDVVETRYRLDGNEATVVAEELVAEAAADPTLRAEMPQLFAPEGHFADCRVDQPSG